jgi:hypothetical protein
VTRTHRRGAHRAPRRPATTLAGLVAAAGLALVLTACGGNPADRLDGETTEAIEDLTGQDVGDIADVLRDYEESLGDVDQPTPEEAQAAYEEWLAGKTDDTDTEDPAMHAGPLGMEAIGAPLTVGDCSNDASVFLGTSQVTPVDCSTRHNVEVYSVVSVADMGEQWPGPDALSAEVESECEAAFEDYVGVPASRSEYQWRDQQPSYETWAEGDRNVLCLAFDLSGDMTGSLRGADR